MKTEALISIRPQYANAILDGFKTVELRRRIPQIEIGSRLWIYSTLPEGAVIGSVLVEGVVRLAPSELWKRYGSRAAIAKKDFDRYFEGTDCSVGILLCNPQRRTPVDLSSLRQVRTDFQPPQVISRLGPVLQNRLSGLGANFV